MQHAPIDDPARHRRTTPQLPISPVAISVPMATATTGTSNRHESHGGANLNSPRKASLPVGPPWRASVVLSGRANRDANAPFSHRTPAEAARTAKKITALASTIVQKTPA